MTNIISLIIDRIYEDKTSNQICEELKISKKQLQYYLSLIKNRGYVFKPFYLSNGDAKYSFNCINSIYKYNNYSDFNISLDEEESEFRTLVISDLHFGNSLERLDLVEKMFDYCIKNNIHIILCCGDILDGTYNRVEQKIKEPLAQIDYFINNYPSEEGIVTLSVLGDHDFSILTDYGYDPSVLINRYRPDVNVSGYNHAFLTAKNEKVGLHHYIKHEPPALASRILLNGHYHNYSTRMTSQKNIIVNVPSLCDINDSLPGALNMILNFNNSYLQSIELKQLAEINNKIVTIGEEEFNVKDVLSLQKNKEKSLL